MTERSYFFVGDVLGFGRIVKNSTPEELDGRIERWVKLVQDVTSRYGLDRLQLISDTLFIAAPASAEGLHGLISCAQALLEDGIEKSLPLRGAIVHGSYTWGQLTYGRALISAYELEQSQNWIGVACGGELPHIASQWDRGRLVCYPPPLKGAQIRLYPVVAWNIPESQRLMTLLMGGGLTLEGEVVTWNIGEKANNTTLFRLYLNALRHFGGDPEKFYGMLPAHAIEAALEKPS